MKDEGFGKLQHGRKVIDMLDIIRYCHENRKVASFYHMENDTNAHLTGYVERFNEDELLIAHISAHGYYDGFILLPTETVFRVDYDGAYEHKMETLYHLKKQTHERIPVYETGEDQRILPDLLRYAKERGFVVSLEMGDDVLSGTVDRYDGETIVLSLVDAYGRFGGTSAVRQEDLWTVAVDTDDEQDLRWMMGGK